MGPSWGPSGADRTQVGPMLAPWTLLSGKMFLKCVNKGVYLTPDFRLYLSVETSCQPYHKTLRAIIDPKEDRGVDARGCKQLVRFEGDTDAETVIWIQVPGDWYLVIVEEGVSVRRQLCRTEPWWRHWMETFSALLTLCAGNSPGTGEFPTQRAVMLGFDISSAPEQTIDYTIETPVIWDATSLIMTLL